MLLVRRMTQVGRRLLLLLLLVRLLLLLERLLLLLLRLLRLEPGLLSLHRCLGLLLRRPRLVRLLRPWLLLGVVLQGWRMPIVCSRIGRPLPWWIWLLRLARERPPAAVAQSASLGVQLAGWAPKRLLLLQLRLLQRRRWLLPVAAPRLLLLQQRGWP
jgi:hypothetical protein